MLKKNTYGCEHSYVEVLQTKSSCVKITPIYLQQAITSNETWLAQELILKNKNVAHSQHKVT